MSVVKKLLISRIDAIGDLALTLPAIGWLKSVQPDLSIEVLASAYASDVARACEFVDQVHIWPSEEAAQAHFFNNLHIDHIIHVHPQPLIARHAKQQGISKRSGVYGRFYHIMNCNDWLFMSRSRTGLHESYLNLLVVAKSTKHAPPSFELFKNNIVRWSGLSHLRSASASSQKKVILHPFSRGSGREWPIGHFAVLAHQLVAHQYVPLLCGTQGDLDRMQSHLHEFPSDTQCLMGAMNLQQYIELIGQSAGLVASGTGPLHVASLMGVPVVGLYPPRPEIDSKRWGVLSPHGSSLQVGLSCSNTCENQSCFCMKKITVDAVATEILKNMSQSQKN